MLKYILTLSLIAVTSTGFIEALEPIEGTSNDGPVPALIATARPVFEIGVITNVGIYYELLDDVYIEKELPKPGGFGAVLARASDYTDVTAPWYYYVQGRGWEGWVDWHYFESTGMPLSGEINTGKLNIRSEPSAKSEVAGQVIEGDRVFIYERSEEEETIGEDSGYWYRIGEGEWVFGAHVDLLSTYDTIWLLGRDSDEIAPEAVEVVVNGIINAPPRPFSFDLPSEWEERPNVTVENATFQSQALYWASLRLMYWNGDDGMEWAAFYAEQLGEYYPENNVYGQDGNLLHPAAAEATRIQIEMYVRLNDKERFEGIIKEAFPKFGAYNYDLYEDRSFYGFEMLNETRDYASDWEPGEAADLLLELAEIAPNRLLKSAAELDAGKLLVAGSNEADIARGQNILWAVVEEYPNQEHNFFYITFNVGQVALVEYIRSLPDDERRFSFLKKYSGDATSFPIRYQALYLLSYGDDGYGAIGTTVFDPLDTGYRDLYDSIQLENKSYWFCP